MEGGGVVGATLGSVGRVLPRLQGEEWPRETGNSWGHRGRTAPTVYMSPLFAAAGPGGGAGGCPFWLHESEEAFHPRT